MVLSNTQKKININSEKTPPSLKIGELLVKEGFLQEEKLKKAIDIQKKESEEIKMPLGMILVKKGFLTEEQLKMLMLHPDIQQEVESVIIKSGVISELKLRESLNKKKNNEGIGEVLVRQGIIGQNELEDLLKRRLDGIKLGKLALKLNMITEQELEDAFRFKRYKRALGEILCDLNLITLSELNLVFQRYNKRLRLGEILLQQDIIDRSTLEKVLSEQNHKGETLGMILVKRSIITVDQLYYALSVQYNIPFYNLDGFIFYEKQKASLRDLIGQKYAEEKLVLPLFLNGGNLTVAISNPSRIKIVDELKSLKSNIRINCMLITDEKFEQLFSILYGELLDTSKVLDINDQRAAVWQDKVVLSNATDRVIIDRLYKKYKNLKMELGGEGLDVNEALFKEFIIDNFNTICSKFHCSNISFYIEGRNGKVEILAAPIVESSRMNNVQASDKETVQCQG
ncbi:GSPII_E-like protein [uncultured Desulfobacterium sp.]|uniref:GSPII_E-like protein n=1 Tax=uncultured Desulfobacterium sp. TaxID=201089 RepID=A0A445MT53_9BACT|nr:GSPII_E-like protein [uncultured Desulfobacterium sp.]